jgi:hypothetical protein
MAAKPKYLRVTNWTRYQHYKDRRPTWIKFYIEMLDDFELTSLPLGVQLLADRMLLVAAKVNNRFPNNPRWIAQQTHIPENVVAMGIPKLTQHGFLTAFSRYQRASNPLAEGYPFASPETEVEKEIDIPLVPLTGKAWAKLETLVRNTAREYTDESLVAELRKRSVDDLTLRRLMAIAEEVRAA